MPTIDLTQAEADALIAMQKTRLDNQPWTYPQLGGSLCIPLSSVDKRESFVLDVSRGHIDLMKGKYQNRARQAVVLLRLDFGGSKHYNPDGQELPCPHLHVYKEGYGDKWAVPVPLDRFASLDNLWETLQDFMRFCNIIDPPNINRGLFA